VGTRVNQIDVFVEHRKAGVWPRRLELRARDLVKQLELRGVALAVTLTTDARIRALNRRWRQKNHATDVLSFPGGPPPPGWPGPLVLGDVVISLDTARRQAKHEGRTLSGELDRYLAHGLLHLLGHDHHAQGPALRMAALEDRLLGTPGMVRAGIRPVRRRRST
jgi:probable rRNA maturation factor